ncbi:hypothetical protein FB45DRAFT_1082814 [Roridomyces roridus]|uniref:Uncharacterized protein n=1 Tax=Roridomyces roridus TaxID=1738132 RepID=A0AAD7BQA5_9AGAR|nr:hypothetical protein FB45DRAFT_1082814 [Roridomyces roridus]
MQAQHLTNPPPPAVKFMFRALSDSETLILKQEALCCNGITTDPRLQAWLDYQQMHSDERDKLDKLQYDRHMRRMKKLMGLGDSSSCKAQTMAPTAKEQVCGRQAAERNRKWQERLQRIAARAHAARVVANACAEWPLHADGAENIDPSIAAGQQREISGESRVTSFCFPPITLKKRDRQDGRESAMPPPFPEDLCHEIALLSSIPTRALLLRLDKYRSGTLLGTLYRDIRVDRNAKEMVHSLATSKKSLAGRVVSLMFDDNSRVDQSESSRVLPMMSNLRHLTIVPHISLTRHVLPHITFQLHSFAVRHGHIDGCWAILVAKQSHLYEIRVDGEYCAEIPDEHALPQLHCIKGSTNALAGFAAKHPLRCMWFMQGPLQKFGWISPRHLDLFSRSPARLTVVHLAAAQFLKLLDKAPQMLFSLRKIVLDEDRDWSRHVSFTTGYFTVPMLHSNRAASLTLLASALDSRFAHLESLLLLCCHYEDEIEPPRRLLKCADADILSELLRPLCTAPQLRTFRLMAVDGFSTRHKWGDDDEEISLLGPGTCPQDVENEYGYVFYCP